MARQNKLPLPLPPGRWRVIWFGNLAPHPQAASALGIYTYFLLTGVPREEWRIAEPQLVSLAHMPMLHIGAEVDGATGTITAAQPSAKLELRTLTLDLGKRNTELVLRSSLAFAGLTEELVQTPDYDSFLIRVKPTGMHCS